MKQFLDKLNFFAEASSHIVKGGKINPRGHNPILIQDLEKLAARMYTGFFSPLEPNSLIIQEKWGEKEITDMGLTTSHPRMGGLAREAKAVLASNPNVYVMGNMTAGRSVAALSQHLNNVPAVLAKGDFVALSEAITEIQYRLNNENNGPFAPLVIQDRKFWGSLFTIEPAVMHDLKKSNIFFANDAEGTQAILKKNWAPLHEEAQPVSAYKIEKPDNIFASTDQIKTGQNSYASSSYDGAFNVAHTVLGPSRIPVEETKSYSGNALVKMTALMQVANARLRGNETDDTILSVHDGGVSFFLMNDKGERYTDLFTDKKFFPTSAEFMNSILSGPGVELAELYKSSPNFKTVMDALFAKVDDVCKKDPRFKPTDLCGMDTAIQRAIPAKDFFAFYDQYATMYPHLNAEQLCEGIALAHAVTIGESQKITVLREPKFNSEPLSLDTENYIEAEGHPGKSRAQVPEWVRTGPNANSYHMLMEGLGAKSVLGDGQNGFWREGKINIKIAVPGMLSGLSAKDSNDPSELKSYLGKSNIKFRMGTEYWRDFRDVNGSNRAAEEFKHVADSHRQNIRKILESHDFLYIPKDCMPSTPREKEEFLLLISSAMVQRQVLKRHAPYIVMEKGPFADDVIELFKSMKNAGLIGQRFEHLVHLTDGSKESAEVINSIARMTRPTVKQSLKLDNVLKLNEPKNYTVTIYCSASNKNAVWKNDVEEYSYFLALQGADLKLGGGNDGMMKASADGYMRGLAELVSQEKVPQGKLHLIQCKDTVTIEGDYEFPEQYKHLAQYIDRRSYETIEERRYDLQRSHMAVGGPGGLGTFEEIVCEFIAKHNGEKDLNMYLLSQSYTQPDGQIGYVYDYLPQVLPLKHEEVHMSHTLGELMKVTNDNIFNAQKRRKAEQAAALGLPSLDVA